MSPSLADQFFASHNYPGAAMETPLLHTTALGAQLGACFDPDKWVDKQVGLLRLKRTTQLP